MSNENDVVTLNFPEPQNKSLTSWCNLLSYPGYSFCVVVLLFCRWFTQCFLSKQLLGYVSQKTYSVSLVNIYSLKLLFLQKMFTVTRYQVFQSNSKNFQTDLFDSYMRLNIDMNYEVYRITQPLRYKDYVTQG